ncbi:MAG: hypothetical protein H6659_13620 [Ardenticatenaceae bacterium]|nr:hypothetical protein [Ardenticatenaceae bacterium]
MTSAGGGTTHVQTRHLTSYGMAECAWIIEGGSITLNIVMPQIQRPLLR